MIRDKFRSYIEENTLRINEFTSVNLEIFELMFNGAESYEDFVRIDNGKKGYKEYFDRCKAEGILN